MSREVEENYYGIGQFVERSNSGDEEFASNLLPGTLTKDNDFEKSISLKSDLREYIFQTFSRRREQKKKKKGQTTDQSEIEHATRFYGLILQWIGALLAKANANVELNTRMGRFIKEAKITEKMLENIDKNEKGEMILVRLLFQWEGRLFVKILKRVRHVLGFDNRFCVSLDIDDDTGSKEDLCEAQFLPQLQAWHGGGNVEYRPTSYTDLEGLPVILVVVNKGKMGITYPKTLRYYDLRRRYATTAGVTRGAMEQDFGRACRYKCEGDPPLPTVIVSKEAEQQLHSVKKLRKQRNKPSGVYLLDPDYRKFMQPSGRKDFPNSESDLKPYQKWIACGSHWDVGNTSTADNRYLLVGRPQIGKTGVFLHLALLLWRAAGKPRYISPTCEDAPVVEIELATSGDEAEDAVEEPNTLINMEAFPDFSLMKELKLEPCSVSSRYGDPNDERVQKHYLVEGNKYPFPDALRGGRNTLMKRTVAKHRFDRAEKESENQGTTANRVIQIRATNPFCSKPIQGGVRKEEMTNMEQLTRIYEEVAIAGLGTLYLRKAKLTSKWNLPQRGTGVPTVKSEIKLPPILIPSSGRAKTALLDLTDAMERKEGFIEIVIVREEEKYEYLNTALLHEVLDVFVMNASNYNTVGEARMVSKKLGEQITDGTGMKHLFILDDNVLFWNGVTLINDPCSLFGLDANHKRSQRTDISLFTVLNHFSINNFDEVKNFNILGFSIGTHKGINKRRQAYGRKHVASAVLINLQKSKDVDYNPKAWAMEDIDFNNRTDDLSSKDRDEGVIAKCLRFVACKKKLPEGGVVPRDYPEEVMRLMQASGEWSRVVQRHVQGQVEGKGEKSKEKRGDGGMDAGLEEGKEAEIERLLSTKASVDEEEADLQRELERMQREYQKQLALKKKEISEKRKIMETLNADIAILQGKEPEEPTEGSERKKKKRHRMHETPEIDPGQLADAKDSKLLPDGLVKQEGDTIKVKCDTTECDCCDITKPFHHFAVCIGKVHGEHGYCHMCSLYGENDKFSSLAEEYVRINKLNSKKRKSM